MLVNIFHTWTLTKIMKRTHFQVGWYLLITNITSILSKIQIKVFKKLKCIFPDSSVFIQTNRQTDKRTNKRTNRQTNKQTNKQTDKQTDKQTNKQTNEQTDKRTNRQTNKTTQNHELQQPSNLYHGGRAIWKSCWNGNQRKCIETYGNKKINGIATAA